MNVSRAHALTLDAADPLRSWRERFARPRDAHGEDLVYLCGHSLGLQPLIAAEYVEEVLSDWRALAVEAHVVARHPWVSFHERLTAPMARLVGARDAEVVAMNSLTVNLHLLLVSFYRPSGDRTRLMIERSAFPSDRYAVESQIRFHGLDPARALIELGPRDGEECLRTEDVIDRIEREGAHLATVWLPGVQYLTGQWLDLEAIAEAAHRAGSTVGFDLAHAVGNVELELHDTDVDFAVWCTYKYLNGGPGAIGGAFVHERHANRDDLPRFAGWWGHDKQTRFAMGPEFHRLPGAEGWQLSNPPVLSMAPLIASLEHFDAVGMPTLRQKSVALINYLVSLIRERLGERVSIVTPANEAERGATLSLGVNATRDRAYAAYEGLRRRGVVTDWREPAVIRAALAPFYNGYEDAWALVDALAAELT
jgi:kynureninase